MAVLKFGYKLTREFARRMPCYEGELMTNHPAFAADSPARCQEGIKAVPVDAPRLPYSAEDDKALDAYLRKFGAYSTIGILGVMLTWCAVVTAWHFVSGLRWVTRADAERVCYVR